MGSHPKGLAESGYTGFCLIQSIKYQRKVFNPTGTRVVDESLAHRQKWLPKMHPLSTAGAHII